MAIRRTTSPRRDSAGSKSRRESLRSEKSRQEPRIALQRPGKKKAENIKKMLAPVREKREKKRISFEGPSIIQNFIMMIFFVFLISFVAVSSFALIYGYRYLTTSEYFLLKTVAIKGNSRIASRDILEIAQLASSTNLVALSIKAVEESLAASPWVKNVSVQRLLPESLTVELSEREPVFWVLHNGTVNYANEQGKIIAPLASGNITSLPALEVEQGAEEATDALPDLVNSLKVAKIPLDMSRISLVRLSAARGVELFVEGTHLKITIGLEDWLANLDRLGRTVADLQRRGELQKVRSIKAQGANVWVETSDFAV